MRKLNALKNMIWAGAIVLCLAALLVSLLFAIFTRYPGAKERGGVHLGEDRAAAAAKSEDGVDAGTGAAAEGDGTLRRLAETVDGGQAYVDSLTFLVDSTMIGLRDYGLLSGGNETTQVWASAAGNLPASGLAECVIRYPNDGSEIGAATAAMVARPARLVLCLGSDGLAQVEKESFIESYASLLRDIRANSPDTTLIVCSLPSVVPDYAGVDGLSSYLVGEANDWIRDVCEQTGAYYADCGSVVRDANGTLMSEYASANGKTLNSTGLNLVLSYLRTHTA
ncbi:MAG: SGNH/GDSL hydrolase family protein [Oscillospiraceae bacterium]|nr:SGNH/GDSL hydrolase family protein [Oscillospiraceae bacterium]